MKNHTTGRKAPSAMLTLVFIVAFIMTGCTTGTDDSKTTFNHPRRLPQLLNLKVNT